MNDKYKPLNLTDDEIADLKAMRDHFWNEDTATRQLLLAKWRRLKFFWNNITNIWYDSVAHDWQIWNAQSLDNSADSDQIYYDQRINVFKAYLESIFAALSVLVPPVKAYPDDASNSLDIETAKAADKIAGLIYRHNEADMLWLHNLYIWGTEGLVCGYNYSKFDKSYGTYKVDEYENKEEIHNVTTCPLCQAVIDDSIVNPESKAEDTNEQESPKEDLNENESLESPVDNQNAGQPNVLQEICPNCQQPITPIVQQETKYNPVFIGTTDEPKGRICLESYGGLNVKIPLYARKQEEVLYLFYCYETHWANAIEMFPDLHDKLSQSMSGTQTGSFSSYEQWARLSTEYRGEYPVNCVTIKHSWFKPSAYNILDEKRAKAWKKKYPEGIRATYVNDLFAEAKCESLDKHWTLEYNPLTDYLSNEPLGMLLTSVQEITNDLISLTKQTIEHGVGLTFVDPQVVDLNAYNQTEVVPGALIPSKPISGNKSLQDGFFEIKTATLSGEVMPFGDQIQSLGQLASGAIPSLFGGQIEGSETASQYSMSTNAAKSRLGNSWKTKCNWWKNYMGKAIKLYVKLIQDHEYEERDVERTDDGNFVNIVIKKSELSGKVGRIELEANEQLPMSWAQRKEILMQLLLSPNPQIVQWLMLPENQPVLREAIGIDNFSVPGADDVDKQWAEIHMLIDSDPIPTNNPLMPVEPSVEVDVLMDTHPIHFEICRKWAVSEVGQYYKYNLPDKYQNVLLHAKQHLDAMNSPNLGMQNANPEGQPEEGANQGNPKKLTDGKAPINGVNNEPVAAS